jgi:CTP synthase
MTKYIFVTGGVVSSVGKGISVASIGRMLKSRHIAISVQKLDPYLNIDPGTMSPYQHGEVFVTKDGAETDLDLGHYERFIDIELTQASNVTSGQVYASVIRQERKGDFLGGTIQVVPHVTNEIKRLIRYAAELSNPDVLIVEVGGTVGDIEGEPFLEAIRQMRNDEGRDNVLFIHVTFLPHIAATNEIKTKPTQHSVKELRRIGIQPDVILCRSDREVSQEIKDKISLFCDVSKEAVIPLVTSDSIYEVPLLLEEAGLGDFIVDRMQLSSTESNMDHWRNLIYNLKTPKDPVVIGLVGKYTELRDAYYSVREALCHAASAHNLTLQLEWINSEELHDGLIDKLKQVQGIIVPGGFGFRGIEGMVETAKFARNKNIPYFGLCLGLHTMVIEFSRYVFQDQDANSTEFDQKTHYPVIDLLPEQKAIDQKGGTMRLGTYPCQLTPHTKAAEAYKTDLVYERHRHRFEFNNNYRQQLQAAGLIISGLSPDGRLVEIVELQNHPWMLSCQFHPEFKSHPDSPHPLFIDFMKMAKDTLIEGSQTSLPMK